MAGSHAVPWRAVLQAVGAVGGILLAGRFLVPVVFRAIGGARMPEVFTGTALLIVVITAFVADQAGLSMSLGAFLAGVLLSGSEYRHELQADIEPFEGLLLGLFFMSVGMEAQLGPGLTEPRTILLGVAGMTAVNLVVAAALGRIAGLNAAGAVRFAAAPSRVRRCRGPARLLSPAECNQQAQVYTDGNIGAPLDPAVNEMVVTGVLRASRAAGVAWLQHGSREDWTDQVGAGSTPVHLR